MNNLQKLRKEKKLTLTSLSNETGVKRTTLNHIENNEQLLNAEEIKILCNYFNVSADYLLGFSNVKNKQMCEELNNDINVILFGLFKDIEKDKAHKLISIIYKIKDLIQ